MVRRSSAPGGVNTFNNGAVRRGCISDCHDYPDPETSSPAPPMTISVRIATWSPRASNGLRKYTAAWQRQLVRALSSVTNRNCAVDTLYIEQ